jgi:asparagine synthase (glutamine-hydrolysing)
MCGFAGFWQAGGVRHDEGIDAVRRMSETIVHRGPDDAGEFIAASDGVALGFRRLAIIDLTPNGHQPMASPSGRWHLVFNGEIYNHHELRAALQAEGVIFRGRSDTEVLCAGFEVWGVQRTLERAAGMFGIAAWDSVQRMLVLARDRIGIKPVYVYAESGYVAFGSELQAVAAGPRFRRALDAEVLSAYCDLLYVPAPRTIWEGLEKLTPGSWLEIADPAAPLPAPRRYWSVEAIARAGRIGGRTIAEEEAVPALERVLGDAVRQHLESDVPLGAFLSGGIDSTSVVALMQANSTRPVRTFTIRFDDPVHDESADAEQVARVLGTDHTTIPLAGDDALDLVPRLPHLYDEPFADASQLPSLLVSQAARRHVTVVLTGDGGDELFAGYNRYRFGVQSFARARVMPGALRGALARLIEAAPAGSIDGAMRGVGAVVPASRRLRLVEEKARKLARLLRGGDDASRYLGLVSTTNHRPGHTEAGRLPLALQRAFRELPEGASLLDRMLLADQLGYLPDNQMTKVDRASMAVSLEARVPILDHRVVELAWQLPARALIRDGVSKWALRQVAYARIPQALLDRPKTGFTVPLARWLRGPLRAWADELLAPAVVRQGPLEAGRVQRTWHALQSGRDDAALATWAFLQFESWRRTWLP